MPAKRAWTARRSFGWRSASPRSAARTRRRPCSARTPRHGYHVSDRSRTGAPAPVATAVRGGRAAVAAGRRGGSRRPGGAARAFARLAPTTPLGRRGVGGRGRLTEVAGLYGNSLSKPRASRRSASTIPKRCCVINERWPSPGQRRRRWESLPRPWWRSIGSRRRQPFSTGSPLPSRTSRAGGSPWLGRPGRGRCRAGAGPLGAIIDLVPKEMGAQVAWAGCSRMQAVSPKPSAAFRDLADLHPDATSPTASSVAWRCSSRASPRRRIG